MRSAWPTGGVHYLSAASEPQAVEGDSDGGLKWLDADEPASQPSQQSQPDASQPPQPSPSQPNQLQSEQHSQAPPNSQHAGRGPTGAASEQAPQPDVASAPLVAANAAPAGAAAEGSPARKRGAPRKRRVRVIPKDEGDVEGFDFAVPLQRKSAVAPAAPTADTAADAAASAGVTAANETLSAPAVDGGRLPLDGNQPAAPAAEADTPFGTEAAQQPEQQQQQQQPSARQPAASPAEVRDTDDWGVEIVDLAADDAAEPAAPDTGGRIAAAAIAEAANNARGGTGVRLHACSCACNHCASEISGILRGARVTCTRASSTVELISPRASLGLP